MEKGSGAAVTRNRLESLNNTGCPMPPLEPFSLLPEGPPAVTQGAQLPVPAFFSQ